MGDRSLITKLQEQLLGAFGHVLIASHVTPSKLMLSGKHLSDEHMSTLAEMGRNGAFNHLDMLCLSTNSIGDEGLCCLAAVLARVYGRKVHVDLSDNCITDDGIKKLYSFIEELGFSNVGKITFNFTGNPGI